MKRKSFGKSVIALILSATLMLSTSAAYVDETVATSGTTESPPVSSQNDDTLTPEPVATPAIVDGNEAAESESVLGANKPDYEITPAPDLEYGTISKKSPFTRASNERKISTLNVNDNVMVPMADGRTLKFRVMAKDLFKFGSGVVLMSTQYTAKLTYVSGQNTTPLGGITFQGTGGSYKDSMARDYLTNRFYNELHPLLKPNMLKASQGEEYYFQPWNYAYVYEHYYYNDFVFIPSTYEVNRNSSSSNIYFGQTWGPNTDWKISNENYFHLRDRYFSNFSSSNSKHSDWYYLYVYYR